MRYLFLICLLAALGASAATSFTEFYVTPSGSNLNSGSTTNNAAIYTGVGDSDGTSVFTPSDGSTPASTVTNGAWGSVYITSGATVAVYVGYVTNVAAGVNGAVTFSQSAKAGTFPAASAGAHTITLKVGGAWVGPSGSTAFPFTFVTTSLTNSSQQECRVNLKGTNTITATIVHANVGPVRWQGYTNTPGDLGRWTLQDTTTAAGYALLQFNGANHDVVDCFFTSTFTSGTGQGLNLNATECLALRCVAAEFTDVGIIGNGAGNIVQCESYHCNRGNNANKGGFGVGTAGVLFFRCVSHDNTNANAVGWGSSQPLNLFNCISCNNSNNGAVYTGTVTSMFKNCDFYNNGGSGIDLSGSTATLVYVENCNFLKNLAYGINSSGTLIQRNGEILNCGFGSGTQANSTADIVAGLQGMNQSGNFSYASNVTPWTDPANGDFRINLAAARAAGAGSFTQAKPGFSGTVGYPDVGAAQSLTNSSSGGGATSYTVAQ